MKKSDRLFISRKKTYIITVIVFCCVFTLYGSDKAYSLDITAGLASWCAWGEQTMSGANYNPDMQSDPALLFGPTLSVKFAENWNITFVYLYGKFNYEDKDSPGSYVPTIYQSKFKSKRSDIDLAINYRLNDYFKIFAGIKVMSFVMLPFEFMEDYGGGGGGGMANNVNPSDTRCDGLGAGLNATFPVAENLFLLGTLSGFIGNAKVDVNTGSQIMQKGFSYKGINSNLSIAYYIASASTTISLGARYQYFKIESNDWDAWSIKVNYSIYGMTLGATYSFSI